MAKADTARANEELMNRDAHDELKQARREFNRSAHDYEHEGDPEDPTADGGQYPPERIFEYVQAELTANYTTDPTLLIPYEGSIKGFRVYITGVEPRSAIIFSLYVNGASIGTVTVPGAEHDDEMTILDSNVADGDEVTVVTPADLKGATGPWYVYVYYTREDVEITA